MRRFLFAVRKCFVQNGFLLGLLSLTSAGGLLYVFSNALAIHPFAYLCFALSAYTLTALVLFLIERIPRWHQTFCGIPRISRYLQDPQLKKRASLCRAFLIGLLLVVYKLAACIGYKSVWFLSMAFYYAVLSLQRGLLLRAETGKPKPLAEDAAFRACGFLMLLLFVAIFGMRLLLFRGGEQIRYPGHMIYAVAAYAFYSLTTAIVHILHRRETDPILIAYRRIHLVSALVSIMILQAALLSSFSENAEGASFANLATGSAVALTALVLGVYMIVGSAPKEIQSEPEGKTDGK